MINPKLTISETKGTISPHDLEKSLADLKSRIEGLIEQYGPDAKLDWDPHFTHRYEHNPSPRFNIVVKRQETNDECAERMAAQLQREQNRIRQLKAELERLENK